MTPKPTWGEVRSEYRKLNKTLDWVEGLLKEDATTVPVPEMPECLEALFGNKPR